ncbi:MAG: hypothetical protein Q8L27_00655 [archaeon]|nr:hypothetical protein [archaeon]
MKKQKDFKVQKEYSYKRKNEGYNFLVIKNNMDTQMNIRGKTTTNQDSFILKYEGSSFEKNRMELHSFSKQICSVEKMLKETIDILNKNGKIKDTSKDSKYYMELRQGSFETIIFILFANPIVTGIASNCVYDYFKYVFNKIKSKSYKKEVESMINNKSIRKSTKDIFSPCITGSDRVTIINGDVTNNLIMGSKEIARMEKNIEEIEDKLPTQDCEEEIIGQIRKLDGVKADGLGDMGKIKLGFVIDGQHEPLEINFKKTLKEEELRRIFFSRIKIKGKTTYRGEERIRILADSYEPSPIKKVTDF